MLSDYDYMKRCEVLATEAAEEGNAPVGALIVKRGEVVCEAREAANTKNDITCHAEIEAIRLAVKQLHTRDLSDCTIYTTHEPCIMCAYSIRFYKISKVVYQHPVAYLGGITSSMPLLTSDIVPPHWGKAPEVVRLK